MVDIPFHSGVMVVATGAVYGVSSGIVVAVAINSAEFVVTRFSHHIAIGAFWRREVFRIAFRAFCIIQLPREMLILSGCKKVLWRQIQGASHRGNDIRLVGCFSGTGRGSFIRLPHIAPSCLGCPCLPSVGGTFHRVGYSLSYRRHAGLRHLYISSKLDIAHNTRKRYAVGKCERLCSASYDLYHRIQHYSCGGKGIGVKFSRLPLESGQVGRESAVEPGKLIGK